ncbi:MAG: helix-turn-helix transcriptional regulator [Labilithrix sp.]|nr:helix-turn-helix transcriptional regulator [Labilithrix sp.]MCW5833828.1 helix-turn-helix transcriptional regulator [Labilithrix sp.]
MHLGATLRLLRVDAGLGLRELARRIGVSSAYLSRVEHGLDAPPTNERLGAIARELGIPATLLVDVTHRVNPFVASYLDEVPAARTLFLEIARRGLTAGELARVQAFIDAELPGARRPVREERAAGLAELLAPERVVLGLECSNVGDLLDVAASRLARATGTPARDLAALLRRAEDDAPGAIGSGLHLSRASVAGAAPIASVVVLGRPLREATPDGLPVRVAVVVVRSRQGGANQVQLLRVARLGARGLADALCDVRRPSQVIAKILELERVR